MADSFRNAATGFLVCRVTLLTDDQLIALIGDKSHKLLQVALGQRIKHNQQYMILLLNEAKKRNLRNSIIDWANKTYNDFLDNKLYDYKLPNIKLALTTWTGIYSIVITNKSRKGNQ